MRCSERPQGFGADAVVVGTRIEAAVLSHGKATCGDSDTVGVKSRLLYQKSTVARLICCHPCPSDGASKVDVTIYVTFNAATSDLLSILLLLGLYDSGLCHCIQRSRFECQ